MLTQIPIEELEGMPKHEIIELTKQISFFKKPLPEKLRKIFRIGFKRYFIELEAKNITAEQFILLNKYTTSEAFTIENLHYIMAVLTYERKWWKKQPFDKDFEAKAELFRKELTIDIAYPVSVFFCEVYRVWLETTKIFLIEKANKLKAKAEMMK